jgi:hypothetical protein
MRENTRFRQARPLLPRAGEGGPQARMRANPRLRRQRPPFRRYRRTPDTNTCQPGRTWDAARLSRGSQDVPRPKAEAHQFKQIRYLSNLSNSSRRSRASLLRKRHHCAMPKNHRSLAPCPLRPLAGEGPGMRASLRCRPVVARIVGCAKAAGRCASFQSDSISFDEFDSLRIDAHRPAGPSSSHESGDTGRCRRFPSPWPSPASGRGDQAGSFSRLAESAEAG